MVAAAARCGCGLWLRARACSGVASLVPSPPSSSPASAGRRAVRRSHAGNLGYAARVSAWSSRIPLSAGCWFELRVAEFDFAASVQEEAEDDAAGVGRDLGSDLMPGPVAGSGDEGEVVLGIMKGISSVWAPLPQPSLAGDAEHQSGAAGDVGDAQVAAEGDGTVVVVLGLDLLAQDGESGGSGNGRGKDGPPVFAGAGIVLVAGPGHLAQEAAIELPVVQAVGERQVA